MTNLPEVQWLWRRIATFTLAACAYAVLVFIIWRIPGTTGEAAGALKWIGLGLIGLLAMAHLVYVTGATITDLSRLANAVKGNDQADS